MRFLFLPKKPLRVRRTLNRAVTESLVILVPKAKRILISVHGNKIMADVNNFIAPRSQYTHTHRPNGCDDVMQTLSEIGQNYYLIEESTIWTEWNCARFATWTCYLRFCRLDCVCVCIDQMDHMDGKEAFPPNIFFPSRVWLNRWDHQPKFDLFENVNRLCDSVLGFSHHWKLNTDSNGENAPFFIYLPSSQPRILHE